MSYFKTKYRIVRDNYAGYEVQERRWWLPFWRQAGFCNTHFTIDSAVEYIKGKSNCVVHYFEDDA